MRLSRRFTWHGQVGPDLLDGFVHVAEAASALRVHRFALTEPLLDFLLDAVGNGRRAGEKKLPLNVLRGPVEAVADLDGRRGRFLPHTHSKGGTKEAMLPAGR